MLTATPSSPAKPGRTAFENLVTDAMRGASQLRQRDYALDHGVDEQALVGYATGALSVYERKEIEQIIIRCEWARKFVVDHIKEQRKECIRAAA
jgi:hypothetical protein